MYVYIGLLFIKDIFYYVGGLKTPIVSNTL